MKRKSIMISGNEVKIDLTGVHQTVTFVTQFWKHSNEQCYESWVPTWFLPSDHFQASMFKHPSDHRLDLLFWEAHKMVVSRMADLSCEGTWLSQVTGLVCETSNAVPLFFLRQSHQVAQVAQADLELITLVLQSPNGGVTGAHIAYFLK